MVKNESVLRVLSDIKRLPFSDGGRRVLENISVTGAERTQLLSPEEGNLARHHSGASKKDSSEKKPEKESTETSDASS